MHAGADIVVRLWRAVLGRRWPLWLGVLLPWCLLRSPSGLLAALMFVAADVFLLRRRVAANWSRWLDGALPELEDSSALLAHAATPLAVLQRERLLGRLRDRDLSVVARARVRGSYHWIAVSLLAAAAVWIPHPREWAPPATARAAVPAAGHAAIVIRIAPPRYTGVAPFESAPRDLLVPERSEVRWCGQGEIELSDGQRLQAGAECARWIATESVFWRWRGARYNLRVKPDLPPQVTVTRPGEMVQVLAGDARTATISVAVRDDYAVSRATLHLTLARGSGENIRFSDREVPLPASNDPQARDWAKQWSLSELGMEPGDELYFFVRASDNAAPPHAVQSPTYTLRLPGPVSADDEASALPTLVKPENLRSQRQVIIDTEQLMADIKAQPKLAAATVRSRSEAIAADQAQLRRRYGQFLGEESTLFGDDDHDKHEKQDVLHEFGHAHDQAENATLFDEGTKKILRRALSAMWDAEKALRAVTPVAALAPEYKALDAVKQLQQADRIYLHKTAFAPPPIKEELRMTGDVVGAKGYRREQGAPHEAVPADLRELLRALGGDDALPALWSRTAHDWIRAHVAGDEQRLQAQRAVQDVADGCVACRPVLRAWLRGAIADAPVLLQATPSSATPFERAWRKAAP
ncbi:hypothetical protein Q4S45_22200 [Massilia sp. R2A-15]|uniref:hypothetical protein n=1 Tax=Massilia sp. R2A-15 TaxID=3064278 RepID=UPI00273772C2|nr:hypothetical protein [Massilia sp. R2A-15]WLI89371.1 hypothetical protein Q4S45_22200 [Massilia sp. R2A-15]